jgi:hypothetical protein
MSSSLKQILGEKDDTVNASLRGGFKEKSGRTGKYKSKIKSESKPEV